MFETSTINIMESELLYFLDYDLRFTEAEACRAFAPFMSTDALMREANSTRASAVSKVLKAGRVRAQQQAVQAQAQAQVEVPPAPPSAIPVPTQRVVQVRSPTLVRQRVSIARLSAHQHRHQPQRTPAVPPPMYSAVSTDSISSSSSSDIASLLDDTSSSSSSSSGWATPEHSEDELVPDAKVYDHSSQAHADSGGLASDQIAAVDALESAITTTTPAKKPFISRPVLLPVGSYAYKHLSQHEQQNRPRKPSDTSSVNTITASSPHAHTHLSIFARRSSKRTVSVSIIHGGHGQGQGRDLAASATMSSLPSSGPTASNRGGGSFLSRMWAATKGHSQDLDFRDRGRDKDRDGGGDGGGDCASSVDRYGHGTGVNPGHHRHGQNAFRRLVHSAHGVSVGAGRGVGEQVVDV
jgi:G1/S-specific cyclin PLC1